MRILKKDDEEHAEMALKSKSGADYRSYSTMQSAFFKKRRRYS